MLLFGLGIHQDIIKKNLSIEHRHAYLIHQIHKHHRCLDEPKWHHHELIMPIKSLKCCLLHILLSHPHLMIPEPQIDLGELGCTLQLIKEVVNPQKGITVLHR